MRRRLFGATAPQLNATEKCFASTQLRIPRKSTMPGRNGDTLLSTNQRVRGSIWEPRRPDVSRQPHQYRWRCHTHWPDSSRSAQCNMGLHTHDIEANHCHVHTAANEELNKQCRRDLRLTDPRDDKKRIEASKDYVLEDSCTWIFDDPAFVDWLNLESSRILWISGDPGKGKTMMVIDLVSKLPGRLKSDSDSKLLSYFFCQNTVPELRSAVSVLRGLIYLLVVETETLLRHVRKPYDDAGSRLFEGPNALYTL